MLQHRGCLVSRLVSARRRRHRSLILLNLVVVQPRDDDVIETALVGLVQAVSKAFDEVLLAVERRRQQQRRRRRQLTFGVFGSNGRRRRREPACDLFGNRFSNRFEIRKSKKSSPEDVCLFGRTFDSRSRWRRNRPLSGRRFKQKGFQHGVGLTGSRKTLRRDFRF